MLGEDFVFDLRLSVNALLSTSRNEEKKNKTHAQIRACAVFFFFSLCSSVRVCKKVKAYKSGEAHAHHSPYQSVRRLTGPMVNANGCHDRYQSGGGHRGRRCCLRQV